MDSISNFLSQPQARDAFLLRVVMRRPWKIEVTDEAPLSIVPMLKGSCWITTETSAASQVHPGDVLMIKSPTSYVLSSSPDVAQAATIGSGQVCSGPDGRDLSEEMKSGVRAWGNDPEGEDEFLVGTYRKRSELGNLMLGSFPGWIQVHNPDPGIVKLLAEETARADIGQNSVLDRLLDVLLITTLRKWISSDDDHMMHLLAAHQDPVVRIATQVMREHPEAAWSVDLLASQAGVSRASLARRFSSTLGVSPMGYLIRWRLAQGAELLESSDQTVAAISRKVGYSTPYSFSTAFKKLYGMSPQAYRHRD